MARIKDASVREAGEAADMVEVVQARTQLLKAGARFTGLCPFHDERTPSFSVNPQDKLYYCFGCGAGGDVISFVRETLRYQIFDSPRPTLTYKDVKFTASYYKKVMEPNEGMYDATDPDLRTTALREAEEEIGLPRDAVEIIGLADVYRTITGFEVTPVVGIVPPDLPLSPHPGEVAALFEAPLHYLLDPAHQQARSAIWRGQERHYYEIDYEGRRIWGATAAMIVNLSRRLVLA